MPGIAVYHGPARPGVTLLVAASDASNKVRGLADYACDGTADEVEINAALAALPADGGTVVLSEGSFALADSIAMGSHEILTGQGYATQIDATGLVDTDAITLASGVLGLLLHSKVSDIRITLPASDSGDGIRTTGGQCSSLILSRIWVDGGDDGAWAITVDGTTGAVVRDVRTDGDCNGIRITNLDNVAFNMGNILLENCEVALDEDSTVGYLLQGNTNGLINLFTLIRCEAKTGASSTTGFYMGSYASNGNFIQCDSEGHNTGYHLGDGTGCGNITLLDCTAYNCTTDVVKNLTGGQYLNVLGGNSDFQDMQSHVRTRMPTIHVTANRNLDDTECGKVMDTEGAAASATYTLTLPAADNDYVYRYTIMNVQATLNAIQIAFAVGAGDAIIDTDGSANASLTSSGALGDSLTLQNINYKYWRVEDKIGTWS